ncbi:hypothetical protein [Paenibacillus sp. UNC499MF]|uniref:hypothetical protein n=1 Tax=Paenibacillus sp. UNC499MF TaxID=1502751 RepID=UPI0008A050C3|nr:hypothetical protein [Paenibacillus sp. UNC499MF]SEG42771.1 hypothetical protein SAMN02799616_02903 [Paenibacillus sp. UNC499MF]
MDLFYFLAIVVIGLLVLIPVNLKLFRKSAQNRQPEKPAEDQASENRGGKGGNLTDDRAAETAEPRGESPAVNSGTSAEAPAAAASPDLADASHAGMAPGRPAEDQAPERAVQAAFQAPETAVASPDAAPAPSPEELEEARFAPAADEPLPPLAQQPEGEPELPPRSQRHAGHTHGRKASLRGGSIRSAAQTRPAEAPLPAELPHEAGSQPAAGTLAAAHSGGGAAESPAASAEPGLQLHPFADRKRSAEPLQAAGADGAAGPRADEAPPEPAAPSDAAPAAAAGSTPAADRTPSGVPAPHAGERAAAAPAGAADGDDGAHSDMDYREALRRGLRPEPETETAPEPRKDEKYDDRKYRDTLRDMFREAAKNAGSGGTDNRK